jgi:hypothetical protein
MGSGRRGRGDHSRWRCLAGAVRRGARVASRCTHLAASRTRRAGPFLAATLRHGVRSVLRPRHGRLRSTDHRHLWCHERRRRCHASTRHAWAARYTAPHRPGKVPLRLGSRAGRPPWRLRRKRPAQRAHMARWQRPRQQTTRRSATRRPGHHGWCQHPTLLPGDRARRGAGGTRAAALLRQQRSSTTGHRRLLRAPPRSRHLGEADRMVCLTVLPGSTPPWRALLMVDVVPRRVAVQADPDPVG